ncbi:hypothetical protein [Aurantibacillus circumpalustris]|uniref:hypothetical protein n=1 Tax=Aurantibacillus circumpalustris TaxID=3036359 RepID=UPI00295B62FC|nr:hypothetical protein [Aurantibacillus circumpalustris]
MFIKILYQLLKIFFMEEETSSITEVEVKIKVRDEESGEMIEAITATSKLTKADAGRNAGDKTEDAIYISITPGSLPNYADAVISANFSGKLTKADAG